MAGASAHVVITSGLGDHYTGGATEFDIEAKTLYDVLKALEARYPGLMEHLEEGCSVAVDGDIHEVTYAQALRPGAEVFFIPKIEGG